MGARKRRLKGNDTPILWLMLLPTVFFLLVLSIYPFLWIARYVLFDYNGFKAYYIGLKSFVRAFSDELFLSSILHTFEYAFLKLIFVLPLSLGIAAFLSKPRRGGGFLKGVYFMPTVISSAVYSLIWYFIFASYNGVLNGYLQLLRAISAPIDWLGSTKYAMWAVIIVSVWGGFGNYMILLLSGITGIDRDVYESAAIDGANGARAFFKITLPMLSPVLKVVIMLAITTAFKDYQVILVLTNGGPQHRTEVMFSYIYQMVFTSTASGTNLQIGYGAVLSVLSAVIVGVVTLIYLRISRRMDDIM